MSYRRKRVTVTIANGTALSTTANVDGWDVIGIEMPATWTAANLTFQGSYDGTNFSNVHTTTAELTVTSGAARDHVIPEATLRGFSHIIVRSGTSGTPVNQAAERTIHLHLQYSYA